MLEARLSYLCSGSRHYITLESLEPLLRSSLGQPGLSLAQELHSVPNTPFSQCLGVILAAKLAFFICHLLEAIAEPTSSFPSKPEAFSSNT